MGPPTTRKGKEVKPSKSKSVAAAKSEFIVRSDKKIEKEWRTDWCWVRVDEPEEFIFLPTELPLKAPGWRDRPCSPLRPHPAGQAQEESGSESEARQPHDLSSSNKADRVAAVREVIPVDDDEEEDDDNALLIVSRSRARTAAAATSTAAAAATAPAVATGSTTTTASAASPGTPAATTPAAVAGAMAATTPAATARDPAATTLAAVAGDAEAATPAVAADTVAAPSMVSVAPRAAATPRAPTARGIFRGFALRRNPPNANLSASAGKRGRDDFPPAAPSKKAHTDAGSGADPATQPRWRWRRQQERQELSRLREETRLAREAQDEATVPVVPEEELHRQLEAQHTENQEALGSLKAAQLKAEEEHRKALATAQARLDEKSDLITRYTGQIQGLCVKLEVQTKTTEGAVTAAARHEIQLNAAKDKKDKLKSNGSNFTDWFRNVRIILEAAKKAYVFDAALGAEPALQKRFEHHSAYAMIGELNTLFQTQARAERYDASERFFNCKMEENSSVSEHVLRMSGYADRLRQLGIEIPNELGIDRVLQSLPPSYKSFVVNYNMQGMDRTLPQLLAMLKTAEVEIKKEHQVLMVNKTTSFKKAKGKKGNFKKGGKTVATPAKKPKSGPKPDTECFYCKGTGHWKRNCPKYLADKKAGNVKGEYLSYEFGTHLRQCGIVSQLTPPGTPQRNGVSERRNRTLLDMVRSMMSLTDLPLSFWGYALETATFTLNRAPSKSVETTPYELWFGKKPKLSFLKVWGCEAYVKRLQPDKLEPKSEKCVFIGYPKETIGYTFYHRSEGKVFVAKTGSFLEKEFLSKEVSGRKVELDEVIEPSLEFECSAAPETVPVHPASAREEANDNDHEVLNETTTELRRSTRTRNTPEWYNVRVMNVMLLDNDEPANYEEAMMSPDSEKWLEAMKSEMGSMYENQVWTLVDLPNDRKAVENKWIFKKKTDADGNVTVYKARLVIKGFGFVQTHGEACIYKKVSGSSVAFLILYVDDILLIGNDIELLKSVKGYLNKSFSMKDLGEAAYILGIKIYRDDSKSQSGYVFI
ncbi:uncharacterized protein LOC112271638, partial [Brachypodium distachyon]|uniref:uncharacterized protein LOC112271638 n=1 Tax=Brachypodium distachyon TaxID=15368 RepID=UPI000D0E0C8A